VSRRWIIALSIVAVIVIGLLLRKGEPPLVPVVRVKRETLVSTLTTNGRVEPVQWQSVRAEAAGLVASVPVKEGQHVMAGALIARIFQPGAEQSLLGAEAHSAETQSMLGTLRTGGNSSQIAALDAELAKSRFDHDIAQRDYDSLSRLEKEQAATTLEVQMAKQRLDEADISIKSLTQRRAALVSANDVAAGRARVAEAESAATAAREKLSFGILKAPIDGTVYSLPVRPGGYVNAGDLVANVGDLDRLRVLVYVDEPELGRIRVGMPVRITWDGLPGRVWNGTVERLPTEVVSLASRQVGEVWATIANDQHDLVPGTTVYVEIKTNVAPNALIIPKAAMRHDRDPAGVFVLRDNHVVWQSLVTGPSDVSNTTVKQGLKEGELVMLPTDQPIKLGDRVRPKLQY
jgi:HlyD family secretion protein